MTIKANDLKQLRQQIRICIEPTNELADELRDLRDTDINYDITDIHELATDLRHELRETESHLHVDLAA